jgi:hypothetical protein
MKKKPSKKRRENDEKIRAVIKSSLDSWSEAPAVINKPAPLIKRWSEEEPEAILDYLHGDTPSDEVKACCYYEYARASEVFRKAREAFDPVDFEESFYRIIVDFPVFRDWRLLEILICPDYPTLPWSELNGAQRKEIQDYFVKPRPTPLITDAWHLDAMHIFDRFKQQADEYKRGVREDIRRMIQRGHSPAIIGNDVVKYVVVTINYKDGIDEVKKNFSSWLGSEANEKLFKKYPKNAINRKNLDSPERYKELLKHLAAWRLYDELGLKEAKRWTRKNRREDMDATDAIRLKRFFREKLFYRKKPSKPINVSPLFKERQQWDAAKEAAQLFLTTEIECGGMG